MEACCLLCTVAKVLRFSRIGQKPVNETGLQRVTNRPCWCFSGKTYFLVYSNEYLDCVLLYHLKRGKKYKKLEGVTERRDRWHTMTQAKHLTYILKYINYCANCVHQNGLSQSLNLLFKLACAVGWRKGVGGFPWHPSPQTEMKASVCVGMQHVTWYTASSNTMLGCLPLKFTW